MTDYKPELAKIVLLGEVFYVNDEKQVKDILDGRSMLIQKVKTILL